MAWGNLSTIAAVVVASVAIALASANLIPTKYLPSADLDPTSYQHMTNLVSFQYLPHLDGLGSSEITWVMWVLSWY